MKHHTFTLAAALTLTAFMAGCGGEADMAEDAELGAELGETEAIGDAGIEEVGFTEWDANQDMGLDETEWGTAWNDRGIFDRWNTTADEGLEREEFGTGLIGAWDRDNDQRLAESEWNEGTSRFFGDADVGAFGDWDANGDSWLDANEVSEGLETNNLYDHVDADRDAVIDDEELADWWFDVFDSDSNARIDQTEWESEWFE